MIVIVDYGMSNLQSVARAFTAAGAKKVIISNKKKDIQSAHKIILPGQGGFPDGMKNLQKSNLTEVLHKAIIKKKIPMLGICLGLQILADIGHEGNKTAGLGFIHGEVRRISIANKRVKLPHVGWDNISIQKRSPLFNHIPNNADFYFVHSYILLPKEDSVVSATCTYSEVFPAAIWHENIFATLFHPEKSQKYGLRLIRNFVEFNS